MKKVQTASWGFSDDMYLCVADWCIMFLEIGIEVNSLSFSNTEERRTPQRLVFVEQGSIPLSSRTRFFFSSSGLELYYPFGLAQESLTWQTRSDAK